MVQKSGLWTPQCASPDSYPGHLFTRKIDTCDIFLQIKNYLRLILIKNNYFIKNNLFQLNSFLITCWKLWGSQLSLSCTSPLRTADNYTEGIARDIDSRCLMLHAIGNCDFPELPCKLRVEWNLQSLTIFLSACSIVDI
ncbi:hypothetical protein I3842_09G211700 [Carya illinoinensis]|uniref:Uncharacterized protein n=1 Tax=Carya illinoinensis TaxID=32201 RepID=A0A922E6D9_CARIL|nr:hypothetical protein I3842_09G211700 [Carya illinoinensis]